MSKEVQIGLQGVNQVLGEFGAIKKWVLERVEQCDNRGRKVDQALKEENLSLI